jgi:hypothetical protein
LINSGVSLMGRIVFIEHDGQTHDVDLVAGKTLMQIAVDNNIPVLMPIVVVSVLVVLAM